MAKQKIKTHRGAAKRLKRTGSGKIVRKRSSARHLLTGKTSRRMRRLRTETLVTGREGKQMRRLLPYK